MKPRILIRPMEVNDIPDVCAIHARVLPTATARMGFVFLSHFYSTVNDRRDLHCVLVAEINNQVVGCISATADLKRTRHMLSSIIRNPNAWISLGVALLRRRITFAQLVERIRTEQNIMTLFPHPYQTILTLLVDATRLRQGIGSKLLSALEKNYPSRSMLYVDTEVSNWRAQQFYEHHGYNRVCAIRSNLVYGKPIKRRTKLFVHTKSEGWRRRV